MGANLCSSKPSSSHATGQGAALKPGYDAHWFTVCQPDDASVTDFGVLKLSFPLESTLPAFYFSYPLPIQPIYPSTYRHTPPYSQMRFVPNSIGCLVLSPQFMSQDRCKYIIPWCCCWCICSRLAVRPIQEFDPRSDPCLDFSRLLRFSRRPA